MQSYFFEFLATYETQKHNTFFCILFLTLINTAPFGTLITPGVVPIMLHTLYTLHILHTVNGDVAKNGRLDTSFWHTYSDQNQKKFLLGVDWPFMTGECQKNWGLTTLKVDF